TSQTKHGLSGAADTKTTYTYPASGAIRPHTLSSLSTTGPSGTSGNTYTYNTSGDTINTTIAGVSTDYTWTDDNQISSATIHASTGDKTTSYLYDAAGSELIQKTPTSRTLYLGGTEINTNGSGTFASVARYYIVNGAIVATRTNPGGLSWLATDHHG